MSILQAVFLGLLQGVTEFVPVSSSGHLVLWPWLLGWPSPSLTFDTTVHLGTLIAVILYLRREVAALWRGWWASVRTRGLPNAEARLAWLLLLSAVPAALMGILLGDVFEGPFASPRAVALWLLVTGTLLVVSERLGTRSRSLDALNVGQALLIGLAQGGAIAPGLSRSGATIATGLLCGLKRDEAARFSFLTGIPVIAGAAGWQMLKSVSAGLAASQLLALAAGFVAALLGGYLAIHLLLGYVRRHSVRPFAYYCWAIGLAALLLSLVR